MVLAIYGGEERELEVLYNLGHSDQNLCHFHSHMSELQEYPTWQGLSVSHSPFLGWLLSLLLGLKKRKNPPRQVTFSLACDMLHEPSILRMQPWMPPTLIHTLVTSWITDSPATWQAAWNSPGPVRSPAAPPFCRWPQAWRPPLGFKSTIVSRSNNYILKSKVRNCKRSSVAHRTEWWLTEIQWDNKVSFRHLFIIQSPRQPINNVPPVSLSSCYLVDWSTHCEASWATYYGEGTALTTSA